jgi:hypothetical protein
MTDDVQVRRPGGRLIVTVPENHDDAHSMRRMLLAIARQRTD